jgi:hypothetical protein
MARAQVVQKPPTRVDAWDKISGVTLNLSREEAKVVFTLLGAVYVGASGPAGQAALRVWESFPDVSELNEENNLYIEDAPALVFKSR